MNSIQIGEKYLQSTLTIYFVRPQTTHSITRTEFTEITNY